MKLSTVGAYGFSILMTTVLGLTACGQKKDDGVTGVSRTQVSGTPAVPTNIAGYQDQSFFITGSSPQGTVMDFSQSVKDFLGSQWTADAVGDITDQSVWARAYIEIGANGQVNTAASRLRVLVSDSYAAQGYNPFYIDISRPTTATYNTSQVTATFHDDFREITLQASILGDQVSGSLTYRNLKDAANGNLKSGTLGYFVTTTCQLLNCGHK